ncbi:MAG: DNA gyrase subunit A, partial [Cyanobacteria bacterium P01_D01_bin.73]
MSIEDSRIVSTNLRNEMSRSYLEYAMSVIVGRALPDARDGLKPVHRRILYAMHELGLSPDRPFRKCARVVGEVLGKYHPHGDGAVYDALVRMAQDFSMRAPLIDGHGNFGSIDNDPAAAMRYTESRLQALARDALLQDIESETVDFSDNFDGSQQEPVVLPARLPQLLLNGSSGIAVGMATNIPPHNLGELVDAMTALIDNPALPNLELMQFVPGPDFPTGAQIFGTSGIKEAYTTGRGSVTMRGVADIEVLERTGAPDKDAIIITELPYQTNKAALIERIADLVNDKKLDGISDIRDESDRDGMRVVIELKRDAYPQVVLNNLYKQTPLQTNFGANMLALVDG